MLMGLIFSFFDIDVHRHDGLWTSAAFRVRLGVTHALLTCWNGYVYG
jgi:hypothetical protein